MPESEPTTSSRLEGLIEADSKLKSACDVLIGICRRENYPWLVLEGLQSSLNALKQVQAAADEAREAIQN